MDNQCRPHFLGMLLLLGAMCLPAAANHAGIRNDVIEPMPDATTASFPKDSKIFWDHEKAQLDGEAFRPFVLAGTGLHGLSSSLTSPAFATIAHLPERVNQSVAAITYPALANDVCWALVSSNTVGLVGWTRSGATAYYVQCQGNVTPAQPLTPANSLMLMRVAISGGAITAVQSLAPSRSPVSDALTLINVQDYGANPDDPGDDTAAIVAAIAAIPGTGSGGLDYTTKGAGCLYFPLPKTNGGFYKVSSTIDLTEKWNGCMMAPALLTQGRESDDTKRRALIKWYGAANTDVLLFHNLIGFDLINISIDCRNIAGTVGIALGPRQTQHSVVKMVRGHHLEVSQCDIGIRHGDYAANGPDVANNTFDDIYLHDNASQGFGQYSGNGLVYVRQGLFSHNGWAPTVAIHGGEAALLQQGANAYCEGGSLHLLDYVGTGDPAPTLGDIGADSCGLRLDNVWSETVTPVVTSRGSSTNASELTGIRHFSAFMTDTTTPTSVTWEADTPLIISGYLFGKVDVQAGNSTLVMDKGTRFYSGAQHTLGLVSTFTGAAIANQHAYVGMPSGALYGRVAIGTYPRTDVGAQQPLSITGLAQQPLIVFCTDNVGNGCGTLSYQPAIASWALLGNGYFDGAVVKSIGAGRMSQIKLNGGDSALGQPGIEVRVDNAAGAGLTKFAPGDPLFSVLYTPVGTGTAPVLTVGAQHLTWASAPPTAGTWALGDVAYNNNPTAGQAAGWVCTSAGTPGTWKPLANVP